MKPTEKRPIKYGKTHLSKGKKRTQIVTFDEDSRKEFITGFQRRKQQRRKFAEKVKKDLEREQKCENRRLKREYKSEILRSLDTVANEEEQPEQEEEKTIQVGSARVTISRVELE